MTVRSGPVEMTNGRVSLGERTFAIFALFILSGAVFGVLLHWDKPEIVASPEGDLVTRYKLLPIYFLTFIILVLRFQQLLPLLQVSWLNLAVVAVALTSTFWSVAPEATILRALGLLGTTGFGLYLALRFEPIEILRLVGVSFGLCAIVSILFVLVDPDVGTMHGFQEGAWRGAFYHKNELGNVMAWAAVAYYLLAIMSKHYRWLYVASFLVAAGLVVLSQSATFLVAISMLPIGTLAIWVLRLETRLAIALSCLIVALAIPLIPLILSSFETMLYLLGRDPNLTGRVDLWQILWTMIYDRPIFGYGYGAFWIGSDAPAATVREVLGWSAGHSHNVWLQAWIDMGLLGLLLFGASFFNAISAAVRNLHRVAGSASQIQVLVLFALFVMNLAESDLLKQPSFQWALYVSAAAGALRSRRLIRNIQPLTISGLAR
jgi:exopolysaccharide production protein ExoQ